MDCTIVGASFAGLACATVLARRGLRVRVLERKHDPGDKLHTTGIIVKEVVDQIALFDSLPSELVRPVPGVRLYAPNMRYVDLDAPGYYFLATDTPNVIRWLAGQAQQAGVELACGTSFTGATKIRGGYRLDGLGDTRYLIGADGPNSQVAKSLALGQNQKFLFGMEYEFAATNPRRRRPPALLPRPQTRPRLHRLDGPRRGRHANRPGTPHASRSAKP